MNIRRLFWKGALIASVTVATAVVLTLYAVAVLYTIAQFREETVYPPRDELQRYLVLGFPVNIPQGYRDWFEAAIRQSPRTPQPWVVDTFTNKIGLVIVYPTMAMPQEWDPGKVRPKVEGEDIIAVRIDPVPGIDIPFRIQEMQEQLEAGKCVVEKLGDTCADPRGLPDPIKEMAYLGTGYNFARCHIDDGPNLNPQCSAQLMLIDEISLHIRFDRRILMQAPDVREKVFGLVCSWFEWPHGKGADPARRPLTINHCR